MIRQRRFWSRQLRHIAALLLIPALLISTGYAAFSQQLAVNTDTTIPGYTSSQNMIMTYNTVEGSQGQSIVYNITMTVKNNGSVAVESWQVLFDMPSDFSQFNCASSIVCSNSGNRATINNGTGNGTLSAGAQTSFTLSFRAGASGYILQNIAVSGVTAIVYQNIPGLTVGTSVGTRTKSGKWYYWPYTFTVTNNSGSSISRWRITAPWNSSSNAVSSMAGTVSYVAGATELTIVRVANLNNGTNFVFTGTLGSTNQNWSLTGMTIQGVY